MLDHCVHVARGIVEEGQGAHVGRREGALVSGTPTAVGPYGFRIRCTDGASSSVNQ